MTDYFDDYFFTSNVSDHTCPGFRNLKCEPPSACARDPNTGRRYCCRYDDVCWTITQECANDGSTTDCGTGGTTWCCVDDREECTKTKNQINICWSQQYDTMRNISTRSLNRTYSSLSSANPDATSWSFDPVKLIAATQTSSTASATASPSSSATSDAPSVTPTDSSTPTPSPSGGLSSGGIAGVVVGVVAGLAIFGVAAVFLWWRRRKSNAAAAPVMGNSAAAGGNGAAQTEMDDKPRYIGAAGFGGPSPSGGMQSSTSTPMPPAGTHSLYMSVASTAPSELPGNMVAPQELPAYPPESHPLMGSQPGTPPQHQTYPAQPQ